jgi:hypothetical protein
MLTFRPLRLATLASLLIAGLAGCAALQPATPEEAAGKRANEYWQERVGRHYDKAYAYTSPAYRETRTADQYTSQFGSGAIITSAEVASVHCEPQKCTVQMKLGVKPLLPNTTLGTISTYVDETWLYEQGQWWLYMAP